MTVSAGSTARRAEGAGREAQDSEWMDRAARAGLVAYAAVYLLIGWLAVQLAFGDREGKPSSSGAMHQLAEQPFGGLLIWAVSIGMFLLVLWKLLDAASSRPTGPACRVTTSYRRRRTGSSRLLTEARSGPPGGRLMPELYH